MDGGTAVTLVELEAAMFWFKVQSGPSFWVPQLSPTVPKRVCWLLILRYAGILRRWDLVVILNRLLFILLLFINIS